MADSILFGIAQNIIENIASAAVQELGSIWGVTRELSELEETISTIKDVLLDAEKKKNHNHQVSNWLKKLEDVVYEADDLMDDFSPEPLLQKPKSGSNIGKKVRNIISSSNQPVFRRIMADKIKDINDRLAAISKNRTDFHLEVRHEESRVVLRAREQTHSYIPEKEVIGRESDRKAILDLLLDTNVEEDVSVLPIVGIGGLGKTTLAQLVFNHEKVQTNYDLKMWVCVSENFYVKSLVEKIIKSSTNHCEKNLEMDQLRGELQKEISGKRYFLVLDDVRNEDREEWLKLKNLLSNGAKGSRIMITTRSEVVGEITTSTMKPYMLGILDNDKSWSLFKHVAFKLEHEPNNPNTRKTAVEIVDKCGGIPLAIRTIGSMLYSKPEAQWSSFLEMEFSRMPQNENDILPTLKLSYDNLPSHLKHCFAYCSLFSKDNEIEVDMLIKLWMAQGFVKSSSLGQSLEEAGFEIFNELHWRSFFQEVKENDTTKKLECKMHDLMHDLAVQVAGTECATLHSVGENIDGRTRHVSFDLDPSGGFSSFWSKENRIRTILFPQQSWNSNILNLDVIVLGLKVLRTLDLHDFRLKTVPNSIGELKHLRYLDLSSNGDIKTLPNSITKLQNLQTLKLSFCHSFQEFPRDFHKLVNLRYLENDGCDSLTHMPSGLGKLTNIRTLNNFVLEKRLNGQFSGGLKELMKLNNLRGQLSIRNLRHGEDARAEYVDAKLNEKQHLHHLKLYWSNRSSDDAFLAQKANDYGITLESLQPHPDLKGLSLFDYWGVKLPNWLPSLTKLDTLCLRKCHEIQHLMPVTQLPFLKSLELFKMYSLQYISNDKVASPSPLLSTLQSLVLRDLPILKGWWKDDLGEEEEEDIPPFECLSQLTIRDCPQLTSNMPFYPYLQGELVLTDNYTLKTFQRTQRMKKKMKMMDSFSPLSKLTSLKVERMENLQSLSEVLTTLISLKYLSIGECPKLKFLCHGIQHLTCLQELHISNCQELVDIYDAGEGNMWQVLNSLRILEFSGLLKLKTLPDGLQQLTSLEKLSLYRCKSLEAIPQWICNLKSLQELHIWGSDKLTSLLVEGMDQLTSLHTLTIGDCLLYDCKEEIDWLYLQSLRILEFTNLPRLEYVPAHLLLLNSFQELRLYYCNNFKLIPTSDNLRLLQKLEIWGSDRLMTSLEDEVMDLLTSLQQLSIRDCPNYEFGDGNRWRALQSLRFLHFEYLPRLKTLPAGLQKVTSLEKLTLDCCKSLEGIPEWIGNLKLLQELTISGCSHNLTSLPEGMLRLTSLQELYISHCLFYKGDGNMWQGLKSLRILWFSDLPQLATLSNGLQQLTSLEELRLYNCNSLVGIPEWIGNLKSLRMLSIWGCSNLTSLPEGMRQLTSLQTLSIWDCPVLKQRCERETGGEDWHKVSHIPRLYLFGPQLQPFTSSSAHGKIFKSVRRLQLCDK